MADFDLQIALDRLAEAMLPDEEVRQQKANAVVISKDGGVHSRALAASLPWYRVDISIPGAAVAGSGVRRVPFPQGGRLRHISLHAKSAPSSEYTIRVTAGGESQHFSLQAGASTAMRSMNIAVNPGSWAIIDVMSAGGAADVEITLQYSVIAGGNSSGGSGGSSGGGGGTAVWGEIGGTLLHQADLSSALAGKASVSHDHDGTYSPATHTHAYSDLTGKPTLGTAAAQNTTAFATAAQGAKADSAVQPADIADFETTTELNARDTASRARANHTGAQAISTVTGLQTALNGKASTSHNHDSAYAAIGHNHDGTYVKPADLAAYSPATHNHDTVYAAISHSHAWGDITGKPTTFAPEAHQHNVSDLTATGTRNSTTILYGDNTWKTAPSGGGGVTDHTALTNIGTNTHAQIDTHIASTSNPHSVTKAQVGLSNVPNTDLTAAVAANTAKISFDSTASTKLAGIEAGAEVNVNADWNAASGDAQILNKPTSFAIGNTYYGRSNANPSSTSTTAVSAATFSTATSLTTVTLSTLIPEVTTGTWDVLVTAFGTMYRSVSTGGTLLYVGDSTTNGVAIGRNFPQTAPTSLTAAVLMKGMAPSGTFEVRYAGFSTAGTTYIVAYGFTVSATRRT